MRRREDSKMRRGDLKQERNGQHYLNISLILYPKCFTISTVKCLDNVLMHFCHFPTVSENRFISVVACLQSIAPVMLALFFDWRELRELNADRLI